MKLKIELQSDGHLKEDIMPRSKMTDEERLKKNRDNSQRWYKDHKEDRNVDRAKKYKEDKEFRDKAKERSAQYYKNKMDAIPDHPENSILIKIDGEYVITYSLKQVALKVGVSYSLLRGRKKKGLIPVSPHTTPGGKWELYTEAMIQGIAYCLQENDWTGLDYIFSQK